jgi:hypothetical protein
LFSRPYRDGVNTIVSMPGEDMRGQQANNMSRKPTIGFVNSIHLGKTPEYFTRDAALLPILVYSTSD